MNLVLFTKLFRGQSLDQVAAATTEAGFDGVDLLIRNGHQVEPGQPVELVAAVERLRQHGLEVPLATTDLTNPDDPSAASLLAACGTAGIGLVRLGYWRYDPAVGHAAALELARRQLAGLARLAEAAGVRVAVQLHGGTIHSSGALTAALLAESDPAWVGAYPDPGNQTVQEGREDWRLTFDLLRPWLRCVGVKNGGWFPAETVPTGQRRWRSDWLGIADGMVPWDEILAFLAADGYEGLLSFHSHYEVPLPQVLDQTRSDLRFARRQFGAAGRRESVSDSGR